MHLTALVAGIEKNSKWIFILEDDAIPASYAFENVNEILENVINKNTWINLNSGAGLVRTRSDKNPDSLGLFQVKPASIRCAVAYLVSIDLAKKIMELSSWIGEIKVHPAPLGSTNFRCPDTTFLNQGLGFTPKIDLETGLRLLLDEKGVTLSTLDN
jgi:GR25 family glycosyltransferase involved in LPS biosynthesis